MQKAELIGSYWTLAGNVHPHSEFEYSPFDFIDRVVAALKAAEVLEARHIKVGDFEKQTIPMPRLIESFAKLCAEAANSGTNILFELIVDAMIRTLPETLEMVQGADAKNGGIMID